MFLGFAKSAEVTTESIMLFAIIVSDHGRKGSRGLFFGSEASGLVISRSYGRGKPPPSLFPRSNEREPGGPPSVTP
jgi:hypothetical protein